MRRVCLHYAKYSVACDFKNISQCNNFATLAMKIIKHAIMIPIFLSIIAQMILLILMIIYLLIFV